MQKSIKFYKVPCKHCLGRGLVFNMMTWLPCPLCKGKGVIRRKRTVYELPKIYDVRNYLSLDRE